MRVFAMQDGGSPWHRIMLPLGELGSHDGWQADIVPAARATASAMTGAGIVVAQRWNSLAALAEWRRQAGRARLVYEIDDDPFSLRDWNVQQAYGVQQIRDAVARAAAAANLVTVSSEPLARVMREYNANVAVLPNHVPEWVLGLPAPAGPRPVVGWHGSPFHDQDMPLIGGPLREFLDAHPDWDAAFVGGDYRHVVGHERCWYAPYVSVAADAARFYRMVDFDIGVAPLRDTVFNRSKSFVKALEYAARGIPVIASDVPAYRDFVIHGVTGFLVKHDREWLTCLDELAGDASLRASMGVKAKEVARDWTIERGWKLWEDAYRSIT